MKKILLLLSASYLCYAAEAELFTVENLSTQLIPAAAELWHQSNTPPEITLEDATASLKRHLSGNLPVCLLALEKSQVVGMVRVVKNDDFPWICKLKQVEGDGITLTDANASPIDDAPVICGLTVTVAHRKKGIGEKLGREALQLIKNLGQEKAFFKIKEEFVPVCLRKGCQKIIEADETNDIIMMCQTK